MARYDELDAYRCVYDTLLMTYRPPILNDRYT